MVSALQRDKLRLRFRRLDVDGNGTIGADDYDAIAARLVTASGRDPGSADARQVRQRFQREWDVVRQMDADGNGTVDVDEFLLAVGRNPSGIAAATMGSGEAAFRLCDVDGDGTLSRDEFAVMMTAYGVGRPDADRAFGRLDRDGDGTVSRAEFALATAQLYTSDDPNAPGNWLLGPPSPG
jgi:Ca2+-binding EF-hand superfamily protein